MLGKLFNLGTGATAGSSSSTQSTSQQPVSTLESVQEDVHTRSLLFPDSHALYQHRHDQVYPLSSTSPVPNTFTSAFDYNSDLELEARDVRVIIMQDALSNVTASLLYDSQSPPPSQSPSPDRPFTMAGTSHFTFQEPRRAPTSPRKPSLTHSQRPVVVQPDSPQLRQGAFDRRPSVHNRNQTLVESESQRAKREYREEITTFSSCIFGNSELMGYKGTSTKVHVVPSEQRSGETSASASIIRDGKGSVGRSNLRSSRLSQSFSSEHVPPFNGPPTPSSTAPRLSSRKKVLITRLFPVNLPADEEPASTPQKRYSEDNAAYPFPMAGEDNKTKKRKPQPKQKRTPMYAVALVINLPQSPYPITSSTLPRSSSRGPSSFTEQDAFPSSFNSARRSGWSMVGQGGGYGVDSFDSTFGSDMEDRMDTITQHWDIIMRTLTHLQSTVSTVLFSMLRQVDLASADPYQSSGSAASTHVSRTPSVSGRRSEDSGSYKLPKTNAKHINLLPNCLMDNRRVGSEVNLAKTRIVAGLRATRAVTGQNRWGIWREEARWIAKWAGGRDQGFFFFNLLTAFLASHTDWLQALAPPSYRRRHLLQQKARADEDASVPARTVIVARDKMAARRLIFLLSAFLPANQHVPSIRAHRPSTSASYGTLSQSPPSYVVPILKEESLRRKINRRTGPRRVSHSRNVSMQSQTRAAGVPATLAHLSMEGRHERRSSDASSIKTANLPIPGTDSTKRKSSAAIATMTTVETNIPHFSTAHRADIFGHRRPGSSSSMAADDLKRLARDDSAGHEAFGGTDSRQNSRWSVISGLWNTRRRESGSTSTMDTRSNLGSRGNEPISPTKKAPPKAEQPSKMVPGGRLVESPVLNEPAGEAPGSPLAKPKHPLTPPKDTGDSSATASQPVAPPKTERVPDPLGAFESPVKTSINIDDGVIDVDVPFPDYLTSFETAVSSPSSSGFLSTPGLGSGLDAFEQSSRISVDGEVPLNVAGWLQQYHPDFVLQAVPAQDDLIEQVKASLRAEPSPYIPPALGDTSIERWMDISSAVVADTTTFSITRIRYRRLVKPKPAVDRGATPLLSSSASTYNAPLQTPTLSPFEMPLEDEFIEERIITLDEALIDAVERVIAFTTDASKGSSAASSRSTSKMRERSNSGSTQSDETRGPAGALSSSSQEVPRARCKTVILSALEGIVRDVVETRDREQMGQCNGRANAREKESALRGAVRGWLESIELGE